MAMVPENTRGRAGHGSDVGRRLGTLQLPEEMVARARLLPRPSRLLARRTQPGQRRPQRLRDDQVMMPPSVRPPRSLQRRQQWPPRPRLRECRSSPATQLATSFRRYQTPVSSEASNTSSFLRNCGHRGVLDEHLAALLPFDPFRAGVPPEEPPELVDKCPGSPACMPAERHRFGGAGPPRRSRLRFSPARRKRQVAGWRLIRAGGSVPGRLFTSESQADGASSNDLMRSAGKLERSDQRDEVPGHREWVLPLAGDYSLPLDADRAIEQLPFAAFWIQNVRRNEQPASCVVSIGMQCQQADSSSAMTSRRRWAAVGDAPSSSVAKGLRQFDRRSTPAPAATPRDAGIGAEGPNACSPLSWPIAAMICAINSVLVRSPGTTSMPHNSAASSISASSSRASSACNGVELSLRHRSRPGFCWHRCQLARQENARQLAYGQLIVVAFAATMPLR